MTRVLPAALFAFAILAGAAGAAQDDRKKAEGLPGVDVTTGSIAAPKPEAEPDDPLPAGEHPGSIRVGGWDVRVGGEIRYEIIFND